jgi:hypothetical protein
MHSAAQGQGDTAATSIFPKYGSECIAHTANLGSHLHRFRQCRANTHIAQSRRLYLTECRTVTYKEDSFTLIQAKQGLCTLNMVGKGRNRMKTVHTVTRKHLINLNTAASAQLTASQRRTPFIVLVSCRTACCTIANHFP